MDVLREFDIEFIKLKEGKHHFEYHLTEPFFKAFHSSLSVQDIRVDLEFTKATNMFTLDFEINGRVNVQCDRCLSDIFLPVKGKHQVLVKVSDHAAGSDDDLIYITSHDYKINIAQHIFDFVMVAIPIKNTCEQVGQTCDPAITGKITSLIDVGEHDDLPERDSDEDE